MSTLNLMTALAPGGAERTAVRGAARPSQREGSAPSGGEQFADVLRRESGAADRDPAARSRTTGPADEPGSGAVPESNAPAEPLTPVTSVAHPAEVDAAGSPVVPVDAAAAALEAEADVVPEQAVDQLGTEPAATGADGSVVAAGTGAAAVGAQTTTATTVPAAGTAEGAAATADPTAGQPSSEQTAGGSAAGQPGQSSAQSSGGQNGQPPAPADQPAQNSQPARPDQGSQPNQAAQAGQAPQPIQAAQPSNAAQPNQAAQPDGAQPQQPTAQPQPALAVSAPATPVSTPAAAPAPAPAAPTHPPVAEQVVPRLASVKDLGDGVHRLTLRVQPEAIGSVRVVAEVRGDAVRLELHGGTEAAREALRAVLPEIKRDLAAVGLHGAQLDLGSADGGRHGWAGERTTGRPGERAGSGTPSGTTQAAPDPPPRRHDGRLDVLA